MSGPSAPRPIVPLSAASQALAGHITVVEPTLDTPFGPLAVPLPIKGKWDSLASQAHPDGGSIQAYLGWPLRLVQFGGTAVYFEHGMIVLRPDGGCHVVYGEIYLRYAALGDVQPTGWSPGLPISDEEAVPNGRRSQFDGADIYWSSGTDAHEVHGAIRDSWQALGGVSGFLGYPLTDETSVRSGSAEIGRMNMFQGGSIYWSSASGAWEVHGDLRRAWLDRFGGPTGPLGWPTSNESSSPSGNLRYNDFQHGVLVWPGSYDGIRMINSVDLYLDRIDSKGSHTTAESLGLAGVWLYVNSSVTTNTSGNASPRFPSSGHYGSNDNVHASLITINPLRGETTIDMSLSGMDAVAIGSDVHLGTINAHFDLDNIFNNPGPQDIWNGDFYAAYSVRDLSPVNPQDPSFRQDLFWGFHNFDTAILTREQFGQTFTDVQGDESGWHPFDDLFYDNVYKTIAADGNCFGMCLEANAALARMALYSESIHTVPDSPTARNEIEIKHGYQVGAAMIDYVVGLFLEGATRDPVRCFNDSLAMYQRNDYPIISLTTDGSIGGSGHAVRPYRWDQSNPNDWVIYIANPNDPSPGGADNDGQSTIHVNPNTNRFSFAFSSGSTWTGDASGGGRMFAVPFSLLCEEPRTPFWETLLALIGGAIIILLGASTTQQITDDLGRTFYNVPAGTAPTRWDQINETATRIPGMARVPLLHKQPLENLNPKIVPGVTPATAATPGAGSQTSAATDPARATLNPGLIEPIVNTLQIPAPEFYRIQGIRPFGVSPAEQGKLTSPEADEATLGLAAMTQALPGGGSPSGKGGSVGVTTIQPGSPAAGSLPLATAATPGAAQMTSGTSLTRTGPVEQLVHAVAPGGGAYTWGLRSAGCSAIASVPAGAQTADVLTLDKPGAAEQTLAIKLGTSAQARPVSLTLANSASGGPSQLRIFNLTNVSLQAGQEFSAALAPDGSQITLQNAGADVSLALEIRAGLGPTAMVSRPTVKLQAGKAAIIQPDSWDPAQISAASVSMSVLDKVGGTVLQQLKIQ